MRELLLALIGLFGLGVIGVVGKALAKHDTDEPDEPGGDAPGHPPVEDTPLPGPAEYWPERADRRPMHPGRDPW